MRRFACYLILCLFISACSKKEEELLPIPSLTEAEITGTWRLADYSIRHEDYAGIYTSDNHSVTQLTESTLLLTFTQFPFVYVGEGTFQTLKYYEGLPDTTRREDDLSWQAGRWASGKPPFVSFSNGMFDDMLRWKIETRQDSLVHLFFRDTLENRVGGIRITSSERTYRMTLVKQ